jgi:long-chain fatty acid transport protein
MTARAALPTVLLVSGLAAVPAVAAGFQIDDQSARAMGMMNAMTAHVDDASALFYNPAGMMRAGKLEAQVGAVVSTTQQYFTGAVSGATTASSSGSTFPAHAYVLYNPGDISLGIGFFSPYGASFSWPAGFEGRFVSQQSTLATYTFNPEAAFRIAPRLRVGLGVQIVRATLEEIQALNFLEQEGNLHLGAAAWGFGANLGVQVDVIPERVLVGLAYRSAVGLNLKGNVHFTNVPIELADSMFDQGVSTTLVLPDKVSLGVAYLPIPELRLALDVNYTSWQRVGAPSVIFLGDPTLDNFNLKLWHHTFNVRVGGEWQWGALVIRGGLEFDQTPAPADTLSPDLPDGNRVGLSVGGGYRLGPFRGDVAYQLLVIGQKVSTNPYLPGRYGGLANVVGLTLGYRM